jgi:hypothetical protein
MSTLADETCVHHPFSAFIAAKTSLTRALLDALLSVMVPLMGVFSTLVERVLIITEVARDE